MFLNFLFFRCDEQDCFVSKTDQRLFFNVVIHRCYIDSNRANCAQENAVDRDEGEVIGDRVEW